MGEKEGNGVEGVSHGMCKECAKKENKKAAEARRRSSAANRANRASIALVGGKIWKYCKAK